MKEDKPFKTSLEAAIASLIGKGVIKKDADVVKALNMSKGTFSAYKSGKTEPSENFVRRFEELYGLQLADFSVDRVNELQEGDNPTQNHMNCNEVKLENQFLKTRISDLERTIQDKERTILDREEIIMLQRQLLGADSSKALRV